MPLLLGKNQFAMWRTLIWCFWQTELRWKAAELDRHGEHAGLLIKCYLQIAIEAITRRLLIQFSRCLKPTECWWDCTWQGRKICLCSVTRHTFSLCNCCSFDASSSGWCRILLTWLFKKGTVSRCCQIGSCIRLRWSGYFEDGAFVFIVAFSSDDWRACESGLVDAFNTALYIYFPAKSNPRIQSP